MYECLAGAGLQNPYAAIFAEIGGREKLAAAAQVDPSLKDEAEEIVGTFLTGPRGRPGGVCLPLSDERRFLPSH